MNREPRSEYTANFTLQPMAQRIEPRVVAHYTRPDRLMFKAALAIASGAVAGLHVGLAVGLIGRVL